MPSQELVAPMPALQCLTVQKQGHLLSTPTSHTQEVVNGYQNFKFCASLVMLFVISENLLKEIAYFGNFGVNYLALRS